MRLVVLKYHILISKDKFHVKKIYITKTMSSIQVVIWKSIKLTISHKNHYYQSPTNICEYYSFIEEILTLKCEMLDHQLFASMLVKV